MLFLIEYDRELGRIETIECFKDSERKTAEDTRLELERKLNTEGNGNEVVLLEAENEEALLRTHGRYFRLNPEDLPNQMDVGKSKAFATGFFQSAHNVAQYMKDYYKPISEAEGKSEAGYKTGCMKRLWLRAYLWMQTLGRMNDPLDFQAISVGNRALLEFLVDLILLHHDQTYKLAAKMFWWGESEKLKASEQIVNFYEEQGISVPDEFEAQKTFFTTHKAKIEKMRETHWPHRKDPTGHPKRWTGNSTLLDDIKEADRLYGSIVRAEIGSTLTEYYRTQYRKMNWRIHSGVASMGDQPAEAFYLICGFGFKWCADFAMLSTKIILVDFELGVPPADLEQEWERIKRKRDHIYVHELYKFHSGTQPQLSFSEQLS